MRSILIAFIVFCSACLSIQAYNVYDWKHTQGLTTDAVPTVFVLDYSNSMSERIDDESKYKILVKSFKTLISKMPESTPVGVRVYGHRWGITNMDACRASSQIVPIDKYNRDELMQSVSKQKPRGMTPITYSLKQTIEKDFPPGNYPKHIILVTDGGENCDGSPCEYAIELMKKRKDVKIDVIAISVHNPDDIEQLACTALVTGGKIHNVETSAQLMRSLENTVSGKMEVDAKIVK